MLVCTPLRTERANATLSVTPTMVLQQVLVEKEVCYFSLAVLSITVDESSAAVKYPSPVCALEQVQKEREGVERDWGMGRR